MYIVFEGIVGSGKSTQSKLLVEYLSQKYSAEKIIHVREPGSTPIAEDIRTLAQGKIWEHEDMHPLTNAYLYTAARAQLLHTIVKPALESQNIVISDRSFFSSCAYQGEAQGLGIDTILSINQDTIRDMIPDVVFYMDIDIEKALSRSFDPHGDKWENMDKSFFSCIAQGYDKCEKLDFIKNRWIRIDANREKGEIHSFIINCINQFGL